MSDDEGSTPPLREFRDFPEDLVPPRATTFAIPIKDLPRGMYVVRGRLFADGARFTLDEVVEELGIEEDE